MQGGTDRVGDQVPAVDPDGPPRALFIAALLLAVLTVGAVLTVAAVRRTPTAPVVIAAVPAPAAEVPNAQPCLPPCPISLATTAAPRRRSRRRRLPRPGVPTKRAPNR